ncbi:MAG: hypothetical protein KC589_03550 [Nanoarchaeota archaeon]|nr:hypothetical protein [Nanoarchaeota archaeon]
MSNYEIISKEGVSNSLVSDILSKKEKELKKLDDEEAKLTYREEKTLDYLKKIDTIKFKDFEAAMKELLALEIPRLENEHIVKIIDLFPKNGTELRAIVSNTGTILVDENVTKVLDVLKKYQK